MDVGNVDRDLYRTRLLPNSVLKKAVLLLARASDILQTADIRIADSSRMQGPRLTYAIR
jgi:hypothetical protein